jgi:tRNA modification GTPase
MKAYAAVMTGRGVGAIATVCVIGEKAGEILKSIFKPTGKGMPRFEVGNILLGTIVDGEKVVDQVVVGCEGENEFAINCHGNPLIVEMIMELLSKYGAEAISAEQLLDSRLRGNDKIAIEAKLEQLKARTIEGYKLLQNQIVGGLSAKAVEWLKAESSEYIQKEAAEILKASQAAQYLIYGCKVVLAGPANSGKSTLLNALAGKEKSIVADIPGTTRDWVSAHCTGGNLAMEIFDTAGLDESLTVDNAIDKAAQERSVALIEQADVVVWVVDGSEESSKLKVQSAKLQFKTKNDSGTSKMILALNKCDLESSINEIAMNKEFGEVVVISAKKGTRIDGLTKKIRTMLGVEGFDLKQAVCFTDRQRKLLEQLCKSESKSDADSLVTQLLKSSMGV